MKMPLRSAWYQMLWILSETWSKCILMFSEGNQVMSASVQKNCTGETQHESKRGWLWHYGILPPPVHWKKVRLANTKVLGKQKAAMGIKGNPASCHQIELPNQTSPLSLNLLPFFTCRNQWGWCTLKQFQQLGHPCMSMAQVPLPSCVLVPHPHTAITVLSELKWNTPPE